MPEKTVRDMLVAKIDELVAMTTRDLDEIKAMTNSSSRTAQSCRVVLTMARVMLDQVRLRAAVRPIDEPAG
jgi:hypothetical protein